jgi:ubiquinone/menaquinone biosynthesis C-methylase UbiE
MSGFQSGAGWDIAWWTPETSEDTKMSSISETSARTWIDYGLALRCVHCHAKLQGETEFPACEGCGERYPMRDGILIVKDQPSDDNKIAADFYNSPLWPKFRFWERFFWFCNGGERKSRKVILDQLPQGPGLKLLDIAIGDGVYTSWLPADWSIVGVDVSIGQLQGSQKRNAGRDLKLILGEAESLPFEDAQFDAILSIGGFNHFNDPERALREMVRVARPGAKIVVSDELPDLTERMLGHKIGLPGMDRWIVSRLMNLGDAFTDLVERHRHMDIAAIGHAVLQDSSYQLIWRGGGYLMVGHAPN